MAKAFAEIAFASRVGASPRMAGCRARPPGALAAVGFAASFAAALASDLARLRQMQHGLAG